MFDTRQTNASSTNRYADAAAKIARLNWRHERIATLKLLQFLRADFFVHENILGACEPQDCGAASKTAASTVTAPNNSPSLPTTGRAANWLSITLNAAFSADSSESS